MLAAAARLSPRGSRHDAFPLAGGVAADAAAPLCRRLGGAQVFLQYRVAIGELFDFYARPQSDGTGVARGGPRLNSEQAMRMLRDFNLCPAKIADLDARTAVRCRSPTPATPHMTRRAHSRVPRAAAALATAGHFVDEAVPPTECCHSSVTRIPLLAADVRTLGASL